MNKLLLSGMLFCAVLPVAHAQNFAFKADLNKVASNGFYQIPIVPELTSKTKADFSDLRLVDQKGKLVPFIIQEPIVPSVAEFISYPILSNITDSASTQVEMELMGAPQADHIYLAIANTSVEKWASISGSDDRNKWYIIKDKVLLTNEEGREDAYFLQSIHFPLSRYRYLKLLIHNGGTDPLHILKVGLIQNNGGDIKNFILLPGTSFSQTDSNGKSYIHIQNQAFYMVERIVPVVAGPPFYKRDAQLFALHPGGKKQLLASVEILSGRRPIISFPPIKAQEFLLQVENGDNPPLKISALNEEQRPRYLVAFLEKRVGYQLWAGNPRATMPGFDLALFKDSIPAALPTLAYGPIRSNAPALATTSSLKGLWAVIIGVLVVVGFFTYKLMQEMKQKAL